jgi:hypothetical protein
MAIAQGLCDPLRRPARRSRLASRRELRYLGASFAAMGRTGRRPRKGTYGRPA